jgi:hypothetical protein
MPKLGSSSPRDNRTSEVADARAAQHPAAVGGAGGVLLRSTDGLVGVLPRPLRDLLRRPLDSPTRPTSEIVGRIVRVTLVLTVVSSVLLTITHLVDVLGLGGRIHSLDADRDGGLWTWASVAAQAAGAALLALLAVTSLRWRAFAWCSAALAFLSLDDSLVIHEKLGAALSFFPHGSRLAWPLVYLPLLAALTIALWRMAEAQDGRWMRVLVRGGLCALVLAVVLEVGTLALFLVGQGDNSVGYEIEVAIEESLEMAGWIWIAGGLAVRVVQHLTDSAASRGVR